MHSTSRVSLFRCLQPSFTLTSPERPERPESPPAAVRVNPLLPRPRFHRPRRPSRPDRTNMLEATLSCGSRRPGRGRQVPARHRVCAPSQRGTCEPVDLLDTAGTRARVEEGLRTIADAVKLAGRNQPKADIPQLIYNWLSNERNGKWIMVLDSADDLRGFFSAARAKAVVTDDHLRHTCRRARTDASSSQPATSSWRIS